MKQKPEQELPEEQPWVFAGVALSREHGFSAVQNPVSAVKASRIQVAC
jgi:hypothetical protein